MHQVHQRTADNFYPKVQISSGINNGPILQAHLPLQSVHLHPCPRHRPPCPRQRPPCGRRHLPPLLHLVSLLPPPNLSGQSVPAARQVYRKRYINIGVNTMNQGFQQSIDNVRMVSNPLTIYSTGLGFTSRLIKHGPFCLSCRDGRAYLVLFPIMTYYSSIPSTERDSVVIEPWGGSWRFAHSNSMFSV